MLITNRSEQSSAVSIHRNNSFIIEESNYIQLGIFDNL